MVQLWFCWGFTVRGKLCNFDHFLVPKSVTSCQGWRETSCDWAPLPMPLYWPSKHSLNIPALEVPGQFDHSQICTVGREGVLRSGPSSWSSQQRAAPACVSVITHTAESINSDYTPISRNIKTADRWSEWHWSSRCTDVFCWVNLQSSHPPASTNPQGFIRLLLKHLMK